VLGVGAAEVLGAADGALDVVGVDESCADALGAPPFWQATEAKARIEMHLPIAYIRPPRPPRASLASASRSRKITAPVYPPHVILFFSFVFFVLLVWRIAVVRNRNGQGGGWGMGGLGASGTRARALVLESSRLSNGVTRGGRRYESHTMKLDIEIPGKPSFVTSGVFLVPRGVVDAVPGSSLEVSVNPKKPSNLVVLGPGGFTGSWIRSGPPNAY
jgi:hypothetical protein